MGATTFEQVGHGKTPKDAFAAARDKALYDYGHRGYTGSLAEKSEFTTIEVPADQDPRAFARKLIDEGDRRIDDKWGAAGCVKLADGEYLFFGWASC